MLDDVDLASIAERERVTRHDVKARIEEFNALAGHEHVHKGMTSRDLTENVEQLQIRRSLELVHAHGVAVVARLAERAVSLPRPGDGGPQPQRRRTGHHAGQAVRVGRRRAAGRADPAAELIDRYPLRGIKGPMGTAQDMLDLFDGDTARLAELERRVAEFLGFTEIFTSVGQVYPRSLDHDVVSALVQVGAGPSSLAHTIRLMAGHELVTEGFQPGQVGSSAMPHKMNTRSCERVNGLQVVLRGYASMAAELAGAQWNEGDVFCSVVRRVALPDAFFAIDGLTETFLTVLDEFGAYPAVIERELDRYLPFLATTRILIAAVRAGVGRETAHEVIKEHAVAVALAMREQGSGARPAGPAGRRPAAAARPCRARRRAGGQAGVHRRGGRSGGPGRRRGRRAGQPLSRRRPSTPRARSCSVGGRVTGSTSPIWTTSPTAFRTHLFAVHRREAPVYWHEPTAHTPDGEGFWSVATHAETLAVLRDPATYSSVTGGYPAYGGTLLQDLAVAGQVLNMMDDPRHSQIRRLVSSGLTPRMIRPVEDDLRVRARRLLDEVAPGEPSTFVVDVAAELPMQMICILLGVPGVRTTLAVRGDRAAVRLRRLPYGRGRAVDGRGGRLADVHLRPGADRGEARHADRRHAVGGRECGARRGRLFPTWSCTCSSACCSAPAPRPPATRWPADCWR